MMVVRSVLGVSFSSLQLELECAAESFRAAKAVMLSRDLVLWFVLWRNSRCVGSLRGHAGAINASIGMWPFLLGTSFSSTWQDYLQPMLQGCEAAELHTRDQRPFLCIVCCFSPKRQDEIGEMGHKSQSNSCGTMLCFPPLSLPISFVAGALCLILAKSCRALLMLGSCCGCRSNSGLQVSIKGCG